LICGFHRGIGRAGVVEVSCKRCAGAAFVKNGTVRGHQRYLCKACGCNFTATPERGKPEAMKALAVLLYAMGNASQGMIAKLLGVSHVTVYRWLRAAGGAAPERAGAAAASPVGVYGWLRAAGGAAPEPAGEPSSGVVQIDEMWHFVNGKKTRFGSGGPTTLWHGEPWPGSWVGVMMRPAADFSTRSASRAVPS